MPAFQYTALTLTGKNKKGFIEADSERHARNIIKEQGLILESISVIQKQKMSASHKMKSNELSLFTRQLATLIKAAIPLEEALKGVSEQTDKNKTKALIMGIRAKVLEGYSLAQAMSDYPNSFPEIYIATVASGEQSGKLDHILEKLADYTEQTEAIKQKIKNALIYPSIMILISITIVSFLITYVVPKIVEVFNSSNQTLPTATIFLISLSSGLKKYGIYILLSIIGLVISAKYALKNIQVKARFHALLLKIPFISYMITTTQVSRYIHTFGILFSSGVSVLETMRVGGDVLTNLSIKSSFEEATIKVREGTNISQALKETGYLSPMATHLIASGEKSGTIAPMMDKTASYMDNEISQIINTGLTLLEPLIILCMGGVVMFIVLATLLPIFSMEQLVG
jgi:general secretion pathway protein F